MKIKKNQGSDKIPQVRFPEFKGEWEFKKLGDIANINPQNSILPESFIYIDLESVKDGRLLKERKIDNNNAPDRAQRLLEKMIFFFKR